MPSFAIPLWLILAAAPQGDSLSPPPHGRPVEAAPLPGRAEVPAAKPEANQTSAAKAPAPASSAKGAGSTNKPAKPPRGPDAPQAVVEDPAEEVVGEVPTTSKSRRKSARKVVTDERADVPERKTAWSSDRYSAVVPPGLTLAALRSQIGKSPTQEAPATGAERNNSSEQVLAEITKAREALRQETARLEALVKATANCTGMSVGERSPAATPMSPTELREASGEQIDSVSKAMKGMKPEQAAALLSRLDRGLAAEILRRMKPADAGAILGILKPELAADLATEIATRKPTRKAASK